MPRTKRQSIPVQDAEPKSDLTQAESKAPAVSLDTVVTPTQLMRKAIEAGNLDMVERFLAMQERVEATAALARFSEAMSAAQAEMRPVSRDAANPQTRSKYASFEALDRALRPIYSKHGFNLSFDTEEGAPAGEVRVICYVAAHGHQRKHHLDMPCDGKGAKGGDVMTKTHAVMSAVSYARRGLLKMIFNVAEGRDVDDDGNAAGGSPVEIISPDQEQKLKAAISACGETEARFCKFWKVSEVGLLPAKDFDAGMKACADVAARKKGAQS